jgi:hypothetical protein
MNIEEEVEAGVKNCWRKNRDKREDTNGREKKKHVKGKDT